MQISFSPINLPKTGVVVLFARASATLGEMGESADKALDGALTRLIKIGRFRGEKGQFAELAAPNLGRTTRILLAGIGKPADLTLNHVEQLGGRVMARLLTSGEKSISVVVDEFDDCPLKASEIAAHVAIGARLRSYRFDKYRTTLKDDAKPSLERLTVLSRSAGRADTLYRSQADVIEGVNFTRDLVSEPANTLTPVEFADRLKMLGDLGVDVTILTPEQMLEMGMGALMGVAQGSSNPPRLVAMEWRGAGTSKNSKPVCFVGKGVTFDTGGISLKPPGGMEDMKWDMGGAGIVSGAMLALAKRKAAAHVVGIVGLVENMPSGKAQRPGDVVTSMSGQTIEVINTDAEGRLVLCDAMHYAQETFQPKCMIDLATLTGAIIVSLGHEHAGMFCNDDGLAEALTAAGKRTGDSVWRMPLGPAYDALINSPIADMKNIGGRYAGSITAAQFLQRFVKNGLPWAHLDVAGMVWSQKDSPLALKGATGYGVRLLDQFVRDTAEK
ncbi:MAG: leucyl aminopeptidase [Pseudomonadota bacterium]